MALSYKHCTVCKGRGKHFEVSFNDKGYKDVTCYNCGGMGKVMQRDEPEQEIEMGTDEYEAQRLGTVIFLIAAGCALLEIGVRFGVADRWTSLPPWYYLIATGLVGFIAWRYHALVANLAWIGVALAIAYFGIVFLFRFVF